MPGLQQGQIRPGEHHRLIPQPQHPGDGVVHLFPQIGALLGEEVPGGGEHRLQSFPVFVGGVGHKQVGIHILINLCQILKESPVKSGALLRGQDGQQPGFGHARPGHPGKADQGVFHGRSPT